MSGGSLDYLCYKFDDAIIRLSKDKYAYRRAFAEHLKLVSEALHDIEWVLSDDYEEGRDKEAVMKCISKKQILTKVISEAECVMLELKELIEENR